MATISCGGGYFVIADFPAGELVADSRTRLPLHRLGGVGRGVDVSPQRTGSIADGDSDVPHARFQIAEYLSKEAGAQKLQIELVETGGFESFIRNFAGQLDLAVVFSGLHATDRHDFRLLPQG